MMTEIILPNSELKRVRWQEILQQEQFRSKLSQYQEIGLARCLPDEELSRMGQVVTKLAENVRTFRTIIQGEV